MTSNFNYEQWLRQPTTPVRNHYFYGKLLDEYHFELEQAYFNRKRWLLNQFTFGTGIISGLEVTSVNSGNQVQISRGIAIDPLGREITVPQAFIVDIRQLTDESGKKTGEEIKGEGTILLYLTYRECKSEPVRIMTGDYSQESACDYSIIQECYVPVVEQESLPSIPSPRPPLVLSPSSSPDAGDVTDRNSDRAEQNDRQLDTGETLLVALARIHLPRTDGTITSRNIDLTIRRAIQSWFHTASPIQTDWQSKSKITIHTFIRDGLKVTFNRTNQIIDSILSTDSVEEWFNAWFIVTVEYPPKIENQQINEASKVRGTILTKRVALEQEIDTRTKTITFHPHPDFHETFLDEIYSSDWANAKPSKPPLCRVVIKCSLLGLPAGDFESWFSLTLN